eukprot:jgi/Hompol1/803/HPOL_005418-RA
MLGSKNDLRYGSINKLASSRSISLGSLAGKQPGADGAAMSSHTPQEKEKDNKTIEKILDKTQRKIDARLQQAEKNLWNADSAQYKAHNSSMYPSRNASSMSNYSVFSAIGNQPIAELADDTDRTVDDDDNSSDEESRPLGEQGRSMSHFLEPLKLPQLDSQGTRASIRKSQRDSLSSSQNGPRRQGSAHRSTSDLLSETTVTQRLTDPSHFPPAYKAKFEAIKKHNEMAKSFGSMAKLSEKRTSSNNLSSKEAEVVKRLTETG